MSDTPQRTTVSDVPRAKVEELAASVRELLTLKDRQAQTQAQLIRSCLQALRMDPNSYKLRGHEGYAAQQKQRSENRRDQRLAFLYLEYLATQLEGTEPTPLDLVATPVNLTKSRG